MQERQVLEEGSVLCCYGYRTLIQGNFAFGIFLIEYVVKKRIATFNIPSNVIQILVCLPLQNFIYLKIGFKGLCVRDDALYATHSWRKSELASWNEELIASLGEKLRVD